MHSCREEDNRFFNSIGLGKDSPVGSLGLFEREDFRLLELIFRDLLGASI